MVGRLDRRIQVGSFSTAKNLSGEDLRTWTYASPIWANVEQSGGSEQFEADQKTGEQVRIFTIRYRSGISQVNQIKYNAQNYDIVSVEEIERKKYLKIMAKINDNG